MDFQKAKETFSATFAEVAFDCNLLSSSTGLTDISILTHEVKYSQTEAD